MKRFRLFTLLFVLSTAVPILPACGDPPVTVVTEPGKKAFAANEVLIRVERLQDAAINANRNGTLQTEIARAIVFATVNIAEISEAATEGWQATARQAWTQAKQEIAQLKPGGQFALIVAAIDEVLGGGQ